jgi:hypothetical protein
MTSPRATVRSALAAVLTGAVLTGCGSTTDAPSSGSAAEQAPTETVPTDTVLAVSIDGLNPDALAQLGREGAPNLHRLVAEGASTMNARTEVRSTDTLPNHTGMLTGRNVDRRWGGHGVEHNEERGGTVHSWAGHHVSSVFEVLGWHGRGGALFAAKDKFRLFPRSWPGPIDRFVFRRDNIRLVTAAKGDLLEQRRAFRFLHLSAPDVAGHRHGFMSARYLETVRRVDRQLGRLVGTIARTPRLAGTTLVVTADHGGRGRHGHSQAGRPANYRVPFIAWGAGVAPGTDLYDLNPDRRDPGYDRVGWQGVQPVRNAELANLALDLLGLPRVPGARADRGQDLDLR